MCSRAIHHPITLLVFPLVASLLSSTLSISVRSDSVNNFTSTALPTPFPSLEEIDSPDLLSSPEPVTSSEQSSPIVITCRGDSCYNPLGYFNCKNNDNSSLEPSLDDMIVLFGQISSSGKISIEYQATLKDRLIEDTLIRRMRFSTYLSIPWQSTMKDGIGTVQCKLDVVRESLRSGLWKYYLPLPFKPFVPPEHSELEWSCCPCSWLTRPIWPPKLLCCGNC